jgi:hypothetical protein
MSATGPLFDGGAVQALDDYRRWTQEQTGKAAEDMWQANMSASFRHPTGYYQSTVSLTNTDASSVVHDTATIYNYWLEGYGSRNSPVTRFAGYFSANRATATVNGRLPGLVDPIPSRFMRAMGGA